MMRRQTAGEYITALWCGATARFSIFLLALCLGGVPAKGAYGERLGLLAREVRPAGAATDQPRATPWVDRHLRVPRRPERAKDPFTCAALSGLAFRSDSASSPGRRPGLTCGCPFGARKRPIANGHEWEPHFHSAPKPPTAERNAPAELEPVAIPEPTAKAMQFYQSGNWLWVISRFWALLVPGILAFSAHRRDCATRPSVWAATGFSRSASTCSYSFPSSLSSIFPSRSIRALSACTPTGFRTRRWRDGWETRSRAWESTWPPALLWSGFLICSWLEAHTAGGCIQPSFRCLFCSSRFWSSQSGSILFSIKFGPMKNKALERSILALADERGHRG